MLDHLRTAEVGKSDQRNHVRARDGRCGRPITLCLAREALRCNDPTIVPAFAV